MCILCINIISSAQTMYYVLFCFPLWLSEGGRKVGNHPKAAQLNLPAAVSPSCTALGYRDPPILPHLSCKSNIAA